MADRQAAKRYAQAAFAIARDGDAIAQWRADLDDVAAVLSDSDAASWFAAPRVAVAERQAAAERALEVGPLALNLARLLIAKGRTLEAREVADAFNRLADEHEGLAQAEITTAVPLQDDQVAAMEQRLGEALGKQITATAAVDSDIIGGVVLRIDDHLIDGSVRSRLRRLRQELSGA
ncbi:MAG: ATP synthase F1 subunit delta [Dehalococcoidia bacterium]|nr:ATP synthase F1 subunit delta [Dehalococcoidia bacterium]MYK26033.1 ATP synthase F1 subunit delta [Dehalococcoidia bacterium]